MAIISSVRTTLRDLVKGRAERSTLKRGGARPQRFIIYGRGRSGSTLLTSLLASAPGVHCDGEILNKHCRFPLQRVFALSARHPQVAYGCKILSYQLRDVHRVPDVRWFLRDLNDAGFKIIYLRRGNLVSHAVSNLRARTFGFHQRGGDASSHGKLEIDPADLISWMESSESLFEYEQRSLEGIAHLPLVYEDDLQNAALLPDTMRRISAFLGVEIDEVSSHLVKISPDKIADSIGNYNHIAASLQGTRFAPHLLTA